MSPIKSLSLALVMGAATVTGAHAADAISYPTSASPEPMPVYDDATFDWSGFYTGIYGVAQDYQDVWEYGVGVYAGANVQFDFFVLGAEIDFQGVTSDTTGGRGYVQGLARGGVAVTDDLLIYAAGGYGGDLSSGDRHILAGGGVEYAVTDDISLRGQYLHGFGNNAGATDTDQISLGAAFHF